MSPPRLLAPVVVRLPQVTSAAPAEIPAKMPQYQRIWGQHVRLKASMLQDARGRESVFEVGAHLLWSAPASTPGQGWYGFRFLTISEAHRARVRAWVAAGGGGTG